MPTTTSNQSNHVNGTTGTTTGQRLTQAHKALSATMPVAKTALDLFDALTTAIGTVAPPEEKPQKNAGEKSGAGKAQQPRYSLFDHVFVLAHHLALALGLIVAVGALCFLAFAFAPVSTTLVLTALVLGSLWGAEVISRRGF